MAQQNNNTLLYVLLGVAAIGGVAWYMKSIKDMKTTQQTNPNFNLNTAESDFPIIIDQGLPETNTSSDVVDTSENVISSQDLRVSSNRNDERNMTFSSASANTNPTTSITGRNVPASYQSGKVENNRLGSIPSFNI